MSLSNAKYENTGQLRRDAYSHKQKKKKKNEKNLKRWPNTNGLT